MYIRLTVLENLIFCHCLSFLLAVRTPPKNQPFSPFSPPPANDMHSLPPTAGPPTAQPSSVHHIGGRGGGGKGQEKRGEGRKEEGRKEGAGREGERRKEGAGREGERDNVIKDFVSKAKPPVSYYVRYSYS